jgi:ribonuclease HII
MGPGKLWPEPEPDNYLFEKNLQGKGYQWIGGLDEVGRGPLAGPVVAACVVLAPNSDYRCYVDSKIISGAERSRLYQKLLDSGAGIGVGVVSESDIDRINILHASLLAMKKAVLALPVLPHFLLVDGNQPIPMTIPQQTLVRGEAKSASIAAASIVAKIIRDEMMDRYHTRYPTYNFRQNKGYATREHREAIKRHGPCAIHRQSFRCVREFTVKLPEKK